MTCSSTRLPLYTYHGSARACGRAYGEENMEMINGFLHMRGFLTRRYLRYASQCWNVLKGWRKPLAEFVKGSAEGARRPVEEMTLLLLSEELGRLSHCTAFGATRAATADGQPIIAQNWDWPAGLYPWSSLLRLQTDSMPATLAYSYPGHWNGAGMNEHGLSLVWTSAGKKVRPRVGLPTYALIAGILACGNCSEALTMLRRARNAGGYIFFLADADGEVWVVEGLPGKSEYIHCTDTIGRANHFEHPVMARLARQHLRRKKGNSRHRARRMKELLEEHHGRINRRIAEAMLRDEQGRAGYTICQTASGKRESATLDSLYCLPARRELWIARGSPVRHPFVRHTI